MSGVNRLTLSDQKKSLFPDATAVIDATVTFDQGDLLYLDTTNHLIKRMAAEGDAATFQGVAEVSITLGKLNGPYPGTAVDAAQAISAIPGPVFNVRGKFPVKAGEAFVPGGAVYADPVSGPANVQGAGTKQIGIYQGANIASTTAGQLIEVLLGARSPNDTLKF